MGGFVKTKLRFELFDPTEEFIRQVVDGNRIRDVWPTRDNHFSEVGHAILAQQLFDYLQKNKHLE